MNLGAFLGRNFDITTLLEKFNGYIDPQTGRYEVDDEELYRFLTTNFYHYNTFEGATDLDKVKNALSEHKGILARIITEVWDNAIASRNSYNDVFVVDYNWLKMTFVYIDPISGGLGEIKENDIVEGNENVRFYVVDKD